MHVFGCVLSVGIHVHVYVLIRSVFGWYVCVHFVGGYALGVMGWMGMVVCDVWMSGVFGWYM